MSVKRYKMARSSSSRMIRKARQALKKMTMNQQIELMLKAGSLTEEQAKRAKEKLEQTASETYPG